MIKYNSDEHKQLVMQFSYYATIDKRNDRETQQLIEIMTNLMTIQYDEITRLKNIIGIKED